VSKPADDLEAVRVVIEAVQGFDAKDQQRIFRWVAEKLGLPAPFHSAPSALARPEHSTPRTAVEPVVDRSSGGAVQDIKSFVAAKNPRSDVQFAATVAYYFQFEAPQAEKKAAISKDELQEACRKAGRERLANPGQTLRNAHQLGLLDKGDESGTFTINTVGENLVAMTLPGDGNAASRASKGARRKAVKKARVVSRKSTAKKANKA
jgi:hypothetical protein